MMKHWLFAAAGSLALLAVGVVHGLWTDRWSTPEETTEAAEKLNALPLQIGEWEGTVTQTRPGQGGAGVAGCIQRTYVNRRLGYSIVLALVNGRPGPVSTHTPEACYGASGFQVGQRQEVRLDTNGRLAQFWTASAVKVKVTEETRVRIYWAWCGGDGWTAATDARTQFPRFRYPVLHKLYVLRDLNAAGVTTTEAGERDPACEAFLEAFLPVADEILFGL